MKKLFLLFAVLFCMAILFISCGGGDGKQTPHKTTVRELFVTNPSSNTISVFDASGNGDLLPLRTFGNLTGLSMPRGIAVDTKNNEIFVVNSFNYTITVYTRTASGNIVPLRIISGPITELNEPTSIAVDTVNNEIFVGNYGGLVTVYARTTNGNVPPLRTISGDATGLIGGRIRVAVDTVNNELIALNDGSGTLSVFARTANGNIPPLRTLSGLNGALSVALDTVNNEIFIGTYSSVLVYARTANGNEVPLRIISGDSTGIGWSAGIAVDTVNNEILVANNKADHNSITVYARTDSGNISPKRILSGDATVPGLPVSIAVDVMNNEIFAGSDNDSVKVYARTANGNAAPLRTVGASTSIKELKGISVDKVNDEVFLVDSGSKSIFVYAKTANGNAAPLRTISGPDTGLSQPSGIAVDVLNNEIFVGNVKEDGTSSVNVYTRTADGNTPPLRTISGPDTGLGVPIGPGGIGAFVVTKGLALDSVNDEIYVIVVSQSNISPGGHSERIVVYPRTANGNEAPLRTISAGFPTINCMAVDTVNNEIFVGEGINSIAVYARIANENAAPLRVISGDATAIFGPNGIAVDAKNNEIFVANPLHYYTADYAITIYARTANGNTAPLRTISGRSIGLNFPSGIALSMQ